MRLRFRAAARSLYRTELWLLVRAPVQRAFRAREMNRPRRVRSPTRDARLTFATDFPRARRGRRSERSDAVRGKSLADTPRLPCVQTRRRTSRRGFRPREETPRCERFVTTAELVRSAARVKRREI